MTYSKDEIFSTLKSITEHLINNTKKYLSKFDTNDAFSFSNNEETRKNHQNVFNKFKVALKNDIEKYENEINKLSVLICEADQNSDKELTEELIKIFDNYNRFAHSVSKFVTECEAYFLGNTFSTTVLTNYIRELLVATEMFRKNI